MSDIVVGGNAQLDLTNPSVEILSPRDPRYAIQFFANSLNTKLAQADAFAESIYRAVIRESSTASQIAQSFEKGSRFVVDMTDATKEAIDKGHLKLVTEHGKLRAQLLDANGHYSTKLDIKEEIFNNGIDPVEMTNTLQLKALQEQLQQVADQIVMINSSVIDVLQGQQNDRIALFYSGMNLYLEAQSVKNPEMKNALMAQAIRALSDGTQQLSLTMESDIEFLTSGQYNKLRGKKAEAIQNRMDSINKAFSFIHQATLARAAIYCEQDEYLAMASLLDEYSRFIEGTVVSNANLLSQCDPNDNGTDDGLWQARAALKLDASELRKSLSSGSEEFYLSIEDGSNEN
ncbi:MAG: hypothetical protein IKU41_04995 [Clostridia bacterium]|nr:hypothetical protein [Clostridia bacterium]